MIGAWCERQAGRKQVQFTFKTTREFLDRRGLSLDDIKKVTLTLARIVGLNYPRFVPLDMKTPDIDRMRNFAATLEPVESFVGFKRHILGYSKESFGILSSRPTHSWAAFE